jgi:HlyD family secretion protein
VFGVGVPVDANTAPAGIRRARFGGNAAEAVMTSGKKARIAGAAIVAAAIIAFGVIQSRRGVVQVQTGRVQRAPLAAVVTASGEIKPKNYVNIGADAFGKIVKLYVKEGARVKRGQMLALRNGANVKIDNRAPQQENR